MAEIDEATLRYIRELSNYPLLTADREKELAKKIQKFKTGKNRDRAIDEIVKHNLKLVVKEAFRFSKKSKLEVNDFIGSGNEGLMRAAEKFNPANFNTRFSTYATYWIREAMQDFVYKASSLITIPVHISNGVARHKKMKMGENGKGETVSDKKLMKNLGVNEAGLKRIVGANSVSVISMNQTVANNNGFENDGAILQDMIKDESISPSEISQNNDDYALLYEALDKLDPETRDIVVSQCLDSDKVKLSKLGKKYNLTGERIRQIKNSALKKLRKRLEKKLRN